MKFIKPAIFGLLCALVPTSWIISDLYRAGIGVGDIAPGALIFHGLGQYKEWSTRRVAVIVLAENKIVEMRPKDGEIANINQPCDTVLCRILYCNQATENEIDDGCEPEDVRRELARTGAE